VLSAEGSVYFARKRACERSSPAAACRSLRGAVSPRSCAATTVRLPLPRHHLSPAFSSSHLPSSGRRGRKDVQALLAPLLCQAYVVPKTGRSMFYGNRLVSVFVAVVERPTDMGLRCCVCALATADRL